MISFNEQIAPISLRISTFPKLITPAFHDGGMKRLPLDFRPTYLDVLCSRGNAVKSHPGNKRFVQLVSDHQQKYATAGSKLEKSLIVSSIIDMIREASPEGGFVKLIDGIWWEVGDNLAREKTGQALRDRLHGKYSSSSKAKKRRRRANEADLASKVEDIVAKANGSSLTVRIKELSTDTNPTSDADFQRIFNLANSELLARIKEESSRKGTGNMNNDSINSMDDSSHRSSTSQSDSVMEL